MNATQSKISERKSLERNDKEDYFEHFSLIKFSATVSFIYENIYSIFHFHLLNKNTCGHYHFIIIVLERIKLNLLKRIL